MSEDQPLLFGPFRFEPTTLRLWRGEREIALRARAKAVLHYLLSHPRRVIAREEVAQHVWAGTHVSKTALRVCIWEIRQALGEETIVPQYIETVGQQGYRWVAETREGHEGSGAARNPGSGVSASARLFVGRQRELDRLHGALDRVQRGQPQLVLVTGEAGVGKTTLVQQFLGQVRAAGSLWVGHGQCSGSTGPGEAYLPLLEALGRLGQAPDGARLVAALRRAAPTWRVQLPLLLDASELTTLPHQVHGASRDRMLRELVDALLLLTAERPLVLVLEDLHWSDPSTAEWLAYVARCPDRLRLLVLGTCRPAEVIARRHPLRQIVQDLVVHQLCQEVRLELLTGAEVQAYVAQRFGPGPQSMAIGAMVHTRTDGNALFMVQVLDYLVQRRLLVQEGGQWVLQGSMAAVGRVLPDGLRALIEQQVEALEPEAQQCLAVASVAGEEFTAAVVAAGLQGAVEAVERVCDGLHQQGQFLAEQELVAWPDGTVTARYTFRHAMYREVVYERLGQAQRVRWHRRVGECLEAGYGRRTREVASTLALHFERGRDVGRAVQYRRAAVEQALVRSAYAEAGEHCQQGLVLLETLPATPERTAQELALRTNLSTVLAVTHGYTAPVLEVNLQRAHALCQEVEATVELVPILVGLSRLSMLRSDRAATEMLLEQDRHLLERVHDATSRVLLHTQLGIAETFRGAHACAEAHYTQVLALHDPAAHRSLLQVYGEDPVANALGVFGWSLWLTGRPEQAWICVQRAVAYAETLAQPYALISALFDAEMVHQLRGELDTAWALAERLVALGREQGFVLYETGGMITQGCILVQRGEVTRGIALTLAGLEQYRGLGAQTLLPFFLSFLAEAHLRCDQVEDGLHVIHEALRLTATNFDCFWEAELHRLRGALLLAQAGTRRSPQGLAAEDAATCFQQALAVARQQGAKALELRAAMSLSRLWQAQGQPDAARTLLADVYSGFTEGFDTADLQAAQSLLETLEGVELR